MANIAISDIETRSERIQNDDLFLMSLHNQTSNTYTSARIDGIKLKSNMTLPSKEHMKRFSYKTIQTSTLIDGMENNQYITYYQLTLPIDSFVQVWGAFVVDTTNTEVVTKGIYHSTQWLSVKFTKDDNSDFYLTLNPQYSGYMKDGFINSSIISFWNGYAPANTTFVLKSNFLDEEKRSIFKNNLYSGPTNLNKLYLWYFDKDAI